MTEVPLRRIRAHVTLTVEGRLSDAPAEDIRAALARHVPQDTGTEHLHLVDVGGVEIVYDEDSTESASAATPSFYERPTPDTLAVRQGVSPVADFDQLLGDFWPAEESADDVICAIKSWRMDEV